MKNIFNYKSFRNNILFCLVFAFISVISICKNTLAQDLIEIEKKYSYESNNLATAQYKLDSLKKVLEKKASVIDYEKRKQNKDDNKITSLMSGTISLSNQIENQQNKIDGITNLLNSIKKELFRAYSEKLDSLNEMLKAGKSNQVKEEVNRQILFYTERKLLVSPVIYSLSYNPEKLANLDLSSVKDPSQKSLYIEYIRNALNEVDDQLKKTDGQLGELNQIMQLQKKINKFLDEADFGREIHPSTRIAQSKTNGTNYSDIGTDITSNREAIKTGVSNSLIVLNQLGKFNTSDDFISLSKNYNYSYKEYQKLLREVKKSLLDYKTILNSKLNSFPKVND